MWAEGKKKWAQTFLIGPQYSFQMKIKFVFIKKSRSQVLEEYWKGTESTFYEVQHETLTISDVLGCHIICWCFLKSTVNTALYLSWFFCSLPCFVLLQYLSHSCWLVHCSFPCRCLFKHLLLSCPSVMQVKALKHSCPMFFFILKVCFQALYHRLVSAPCRYCEWHWFWHWNLFHVAESWL